jgi:hypothetical protein
MEQIRLPKHTVDAIERRWSSRFDRSVARIKSDDARQACLRAHQGNIRRYRRLLQTKLADLERRFIETRLREEQTALERLSETGVAIPPIIGAIRHGATPMAERELRHE